MWQTADALALAATGPEPPSALRERILGTARAEPQVVVPLAPRASRATPVLGAVAAVAAVLLLAVGAWAMQLSGDLDETRAALDRATVNGKVLADPSAQTVSLTTGDGRLVVDDEGRAVLVVDGLGPAPEGKTYELWIVPGGDLASANPAGLFPGRDGTEVVGLDGAVEPGDVVAVTIEQAGGVGSPTSEPVVASESV